MAHLAEMRLFDYVFIRLRELFECDFCPKTVFKTVAIVLLIIILAGLHALDILCFQ